MTSERQEGGRHANDEQRTAHSAQQTQHAQQAERTVLKNMVFSSTPWMLKVLLMELWQGAKKSGGS